MMHSQQQAAAVAARYQNLFACVVSDKQQCVLTCSLAVMLGATSSSCTSPTKIVNARSRFASRSPPFERHLHAQPDTQKDHPRVLNESDAGTPSSTVHAEPGKQQLASQRVERVLHM